MSRGFRPGEAEAIYAAAENIKAQKQAAEEDRREHGTYDMKTKGITISEDDALKQIRDGLRLCQNADHVKIWHDVESFRREHRNEPGISDILGVVTIPIQALVEAGIQEVGVAMAIEVKGTDTDVKGSQVQFMERWRKRGAIVGIGRSYEDVKRIIREKIPGAKLEGPR